MSEEDLAQRITNLENDMMLVRDGTLGWKARDKCRVYLSATQSNIVNSTPTKVTLDTASYDGSTLFNSSLNRIIIKKPGWYLVTTQITYSGITADKRYLNMVYKNGSEFLRNNGQAPLASYFGVPLSDISYFDINDYLELFAFHIAGVDTPDIASSSKYTFMSVHLLSRD